MNLVDQNKHVICSGHVIGFRTDIFDNLNRSGPALGYVRFELTTSSSLGARSNQLS